MAVPAKAATALRMFVPRLLLTCRRERSRGKRPGGEGTEEGATALPPPPPWARAQWPPCDACVSDPSPFSGAPPTPQGRPAAFTVGGVCSRVPAYPRGARPPRPVPCGCSCPRSKSQGGPLLWTPRPSWEGDGVASMRFHTADSRVQGAGESLGAGAEVRVGQPTRLRVKGMSGWSRRSLRAHPPSAAET